ncbi:MAG: hypothetical protein AAGJ40_19910 [Planctomycetota bacterium]
MSSSPFEIFRRNLKPMMVFLVLLAMFSFVVLPALDQYLRRGGGGGGDPVAATYDGVELRASHVARTTQSHQGVVRFLMELATETLRRGGVPQTPGFRVDEQSGQIQSLGIDSNPGRQASINAMRYYSEAKKAGFELDDTSIKNWLSRFTDNTLSDSEITQILMRSTGNRLGQLSLYEQLRMHLLADLYQRGALIGLTQGQFPVVTPVGQWQNFLKLNQQARANAYGILVSEYLDQTDANPPESEITSVYEEGKTRIAYPNDQDPTPKFRRPDEAKLEFIVADLNKFVEVEKAKLTDDALKAEYERRLAGGDFQLPTEALDELTKEMGEAEESGDLASEAADESNGSETTDDNEPDDAPEPSSDAPGASGDSDAPEMSAAENENPASGAESDEVETIVEEFNPDAADGSGQATEAPEKGDGASIESWPPAATRLVAFQDDEESSETISVDNPTTDETDTDTSDATESSADEEADDAMAEEDATDGLALDDEEDGLALEDEATKPQSFEDVKDEIATDMATEPARQALDQAVTEISGKMRRYFSELSIYESNFSVGVATEADAPKRPDLAALAESLGLSHGTTEMVNRVSVGDTEPGSSFGLGSNFNQRGAPFVSMLFGAQMQDGSIIPAQPVFAPVQTVDLEAAKSFVTWKTEDVESFIPTLDQVRDEVILAIRTRQARDLARAEAAKMAGSVNSGESLEALVPEGKEPNWFPDLGPFTWLDQVGFMQTTIGNVPQLDSVGEEFMTSVFSTPIGEAAVAANGPQSVIYVVTPTELQPDVEQLQDQFKQPQQRFMALLLGSQDARELMNGFFKAVDERTGFELTALDEE